MITLKQVADRAGVSSATVSKVLSNTPYVSVETRERVLQAVDDLGYVPNLAARALARGRTYNIGVIFPLIHTSLFSDPQTLSILEGVETVVSARGYNILITTPPTPVQKSDQYRRLVRSRYCDGLILLENLPDQRMSRFVAAHGYPFVAIGYQSLEDHSNTIRIDDYEGAYAAAQHLADLGHRHIGIIAAGPMPMFSIRERLRGYRDALTAAGIDYERLPIAHGTFSIDSGGAALLRLLAGACPRPTAILCVTDLMAFGAINAARGAGLRLPHDLSIVGFDDIPLAAHIDPPLTTVRQQSRALGETAATLLLDILEKKQSTFDPVVLPTQLIVRGSTAPVYPAHEEVSA